MMGTRYVGAGVLASAVGMDKHFTKLILAANGLPIGPFVPITAAEWARDPVACLEAVAALTYPLFVKPARGGSSLGISKVDDPSTLERAIELAHEHDPKVIVEQGFVGARELECGVLADLDGGPPQASQVAEIRVHSESGVLRLRGQVPARGAGRPRRAGRCRSRAGRAGARAGGPHLRGDRAARDWPGSTCSSPTITAC